MTDSIVLTGVVATTPRTITTSEGLAITSFRLASSLRRFDKPTSTWIDGGTNWYSVSAFRRLAENAAVSLQKGDRVVASGRVRVREWENSGRSGMTVEVEADAIGHDLNWGTAAFQKRVSVAADASESVVPTTTAAAAATETETEQSWAEGELAVPF